MKGIKLPFDIPPIVRNFYVVVSVVFTLWMMFFDDNNIINRIKNRSRLSDIRTEKQYYLDKIQEVHQNRAEVLGNTKLLERYAREHYLMKKPEEDLYIILPEGTQPPTNTSKR